MKTRRHAIATGGVPGGFGTMVLTGMLWAVAAGGAQAETNLLEQRFQVALGTFTNASDLTIRLDGEAGEAGTDVNWDRKFGDQEDTRLRVDALWRFAERHFLRLMYTDYSDTNVRTLEDEIIWDGDVIPVGATATAKFSFDIIELAYEYAFMRSQDFELTGSIGLHYTDIEAIITADVDIGDEQITEQRGGRASTGAPLPVVGARTLWRFHDNFYLDVLGQAFYLSFDEFDGTILNARAAVTWQPKSWIGVGIGYDWFNVDIDVDRSSFRGSMDWTYKGPQVFLSASF